MRRLLGLCILGLSIFACGEETGPSDGDGDRAGDRGQRAGAAGESFELRPRLRLVGLGEISELLQVERLEFEAELFILPDELDQVGDAIPIRFVFDDDGERTELLERALRLQGPGAYQVLVRVRPDDDGVSVAVGGAYTAPDEEAIERDKADDEPAPSPSEPAPSPSEPAPSPSEPAPSPSEPAPSPSDNPAEEPAPSPSEGLPFAEPAPSPSEGDPDDARGKADDDFALDTGDTLADGDPLFVRSRRSFEFYAGIVEVTATDRELLVTWDVRDWLRGVLSEPLGLMLPSAELPSEEALPPRPGFDDVPTDFRIDAR